LVASEGTDEAGRVATAQALIFAAVLMRGELQ
jgi:hypothetical protein